MVIRHGQLATLADKMRFWLLVSRVDILTGNRCTDFGYDCSVRYSCSQVNAICGFLSFCSYYCEFEKFMQAFCTLAQNVQLCATVFKVQIIVCLIICLVCQSIPRSECIERVNMPTR